MRRVLGVAVMAATLSITAPLHAQDSDAIRFKTSALELTFGGRVQVQAGTSSCNEFPVPDDSACARQVPSSDLFRSPDGERQDQRHDRLPDPA